ncbi:carbonic anhydrase [[Phormidium] sp. ETS-05]|uniref:carbonic anhydrase n=1 Tax=[Phormidium] sp. ETS-05 TaxID=222819 RepID=UPI0018EF0F7A|nr:carbonic anhydrase family protein [[Phormidium] sp. ETS-05]
MKTLTRILKISLISLIFTNISCQPVTPPETSTSPSTATSNPPAPEPASWHYGGAHNPTKWGDLKPEYAACKNGSSQSPINLDPAKISKANPAKIEFSYQDVPLNITNNGHRIQVNYPPGSWVKIGEQKYDLLQFHFHTPSEHTVSNQAAGMELHLVHKNQAGNLAVVAVLIQEGKPNELLALLWEDIPDIGEVEESDLKINASKLLPANRAYYSYSGSLTTPPCSEGVNWQVLATPIEASPEQIEEFAEIYHVNARPVQPVNQRQITLHK